MLRRPKSEGSVRIKRNRPKLDVTVRNYKGLHFIKSNILKAEGSQRNKTESDYLP